MNRSYVAFISYKHARRDAAIAKEVHTLIENYVIPPSLRKGSRKLGVVFRDEEELPISADLSDSIQTALRASQFLILVCSPEAMASPWVHREIDYFLQTHDANKVFVVLADGEPKDVFPEAITRVYDPSVGEYQEVEPLALDVRADTIQSSLKRVRERIKKLYAAMLGCAYDSLVQREKVRRMKRAMALAAVMMVVASSFVAVILSKNLELSQKNAELYEATQTALKREAMLLTEDAEQALENNDIIAALENAASALYSSEIERPYCAPAERVLFSALNVFGDAPVLLSNTELLHPSPVTSAVYSADGKYIYSMDSYGAVSCFDASSGTTVWSVHMPDNSLFFFSKTEGQLWFDTKSGMLLSSFDGTLAGINAVTGEFVWSRQMTTGLVHGPFFDAERQSLAFVESVNVNSPEGITEAVDYQFVSLRASDGARQREVPLITATDTKLVGFPSHSSSGGMFTDSGRFVGTLFYQEGEVSKALLYWIDVDAASANLIDNETFESVLDRYSHERTVCLDEQRALVISSRNGIHMRCFDLENRQLVWEATVPHHQNMKYFDGAEYIFHRRNSDFLIGYANCLYLIDSSDGSLKTAALQEDQVVGIWPLQPGLFGYALANGYCAVGWVSMDAIRDSVLFSATLDLPEMTSIVPYNQGLIHADISGNQINSMSLVPPQAGGGSVLCLSGDGLVVNVITVLPGAVRAEAVPLQPLGEKAEDFGKYIHTNPSGIVLLNRTSVGTDGYLVAADTASRTYWKIPLGQIAEDANQFLLAEDGQGAVAFRQYGNIFYVSADGTGNVLSEEEEIFLGEIDQTQYFAPRYDCDAAMQAADGSILSVRCDGERIDTWIGQKQSVSVTVPDDIRWIARRGLVSDCMLRVSPGGMLVLSHWASDNAETMDSFAVYSLAGRTWKRIPDEGRGNGERITAFGSQSPLFAVYDEDNCIRIYDMAQARLVYRIETAVPSSYVQKISILPGDRQISLATQDGQFVIYDVETGSPVFSTMISGYFSGRDFSVWLDEDNFRLFVRLDRKGLCIDTRSWEELFTLDNGDDFLFYSEARNEICILQNRYVDPVLMAIPVPTTNELVQAALDILQQGR